MYNIGTTSHDYRVIRQHRKRHIHTRALSRAELRSNVGRGTTTIASHRLTDGRREGGVVITTHLPTPEGWMADRVDHIG